MLLEVQKCLRKLLTKKLSKVLPLFSSSTFPSRVWCKCRAELSNCKDQMTALDQKNSVEKFLNWRLENSLQNWLKWKLDLVKFSQLALNWLKWEPSVIWEQCVLSLLNLSLCWLCYFKQIWQKTYLLQSRQLLVFKELIRPNDSYGLGNCQALNPLWAYHVSPRGAWLLWLLYFCSYKSIWAYSMPNANAYSMQSSVTSPYCSNEAQMRAVICEQSIWSLVIR